MRLALETCHGAVVQARRDLVDRRTALTNQLTSLLKSYYPQALQLVDTLNSGLAIALLRRWPDLLQLKTAKPGVIRRFYYQHQIRSAQLIQARLDPIAQGPWR